MIFTAMVHESSLASNGLIDFFGAFIGFSKVGDMSHIYPDIYDMSMTPS